MELDETKLYQIIDKVYQQTTLRKIEWKVESVNKANYFIANISIYKIAIFNTGFSYVFEVYDKAGNLLATKTSGSMSATQWLLNTKIPFGTDIFKELYELAKNIALKIDQNLDDLLDNLNKL
jgi:hypothetical protein